MLAWLREPTRDISPEASFVLTRCAPIAVAQLVWEVRWDGTKNELAVVLDDTAIDEAQACTIGAIGPGAMIIMGCD